MHLRCTYHIKKSYLWMYWSAVCIHCCWAELLTLAESREVQGGRWAHAGNTLHLENEPYSGKAFHIKLLCRWGAMSSLLFISPSSFKLTSSNWKCILLYWAELRWVSRSCSLSSDYSSSNTFNPVLQNLLAPPLRPTPLIHLVSSIRKPI